MEILALEDLVVGFGVAFTTLLALVGAAEAIVLAGMAEEEAAGARLLWAEWPLPETAPERKVEFRLAA
jgi:hypothetical protein